jgi:hypothetical protein
MAGDEQFLSWDLADVVSGKPPRDDIWRGADGLAALQSGQGSINMPLLRLGVKLRAGTAAEQATAIASWKNVFAFFQKQWMGSELGSRIYGVWHMLAVASVLDWAKTNQGPDAEVLGTLASGWLLHWWCLLKLVEAPDGRLLMVGMRSGGHRPDPGFLEWTTALAMDGPVDRWEAEAKRLQLGLRQNWIYSAALSLKETLRASTAPIRAGQDPLALIPRYGLIEPYNILRTEKGLAVWIGRNQNGNTTPLAGAVWTPEGLDWLPKDGGNRIRQKFETIDCRPVGLNLVYDSDHQGHQELPLPTGQVLAQITLTLGTPAVPVAPIGEKDSTAPPPTPISLPDRTPETPAGSKPIPPATAPRSPQAIADDILTLGVPRKQLGLRQSLADQVRQLPAGRPPADLASDLGTLGISQGQLVLWHRLQAEVASFRQG